MAQPPSTPLSVVVLGLSITSSWGNGHATTFRALLKGMKARGHDVLFLERDKPWYADNRDLPSPDFCRLALYDSPEELAERHAAAVRAADLVIVGSYVPDGVAVGRWVQDTAGGVTAFYDIDTPVTVARLERGDAEYVSREIIPGFDLYLSFTGGPTLDRLEREFGARRARVLYCSVDADAYYPELGPVRWDLGYLGTYSPDRQPVLERLLLEPARRRERDSFIVAGPQYPDTVDWPANVERVSHLPPSEHRRFYNAQRFTLNVTRADMVAAGWSPSVRLFEAAACGTPIISDRWSGLEELFVPGEEILIADDGDQVMRWLRDTEPRRARAIGRAARRRVLAAHTGERRAAELEAYVREVRGAARSVRAL
ncbi:CgeB family protein [Azospirillum halopraeferens]|uniref:CgeB family protein n=1 Tax=Azospirillum halopraeferens TaxID=34010 RepID=UPI000402EBDB|nr:glycosyltransferase [Azospirillum halopraeferens]